MPGCVGERVGSVRWQRTVADHRDRRRAGVRGSGYTVRDQEGGSTWTASDCAHTIWLSLRPRSVPLAMGYTVWHFVVDEPTGVLKRIPAVRWWAFWNGKIPVAEWAGQEVRTIELA